MVNTVARGNHEALNLLLEKVYRDGGYDFRDYKDGTVMRRLERRLQATGVETYADYMRYLDAHPEEYEGLAQALTIALSGFFRNRTSFDQVARLVLPELLAHKISQKKHSLRFWSSACARGEEPYSIAITLAEFLKNKPGDFDIRVYATDINRKILKEARAGTYSPKEVENLPPDIVERYLTADNKGYVVRAYIKKMVCFSYFDLTSSAKPPFGEVDCIFCCNVLIYLQKQLQKRLLDRLYQVLTVPGFLVLGEVETPTENLRQQLECLDTKAKIYKKSGDETSDSQAGNDETDYR
jgi:chemotaxis methyl-accepting protein methylase